MAVLPPQPAVPQSPRATAHYVPTYVSQTMTHFTEPEMQKLAEVYKDFDCLWNIRHKFYKSREVRQAAYEKMLERLNIPGLTVQDIPKKIKNFRSSYYQEIKRIRNSINAGDSEESAYKPKVSWFACADQYLSSIWTEKHLKYYRPKEDFNVFIQGTEVQVKKNKPNDNNTHKRIQIPTVMANSTAPEKSVSKKVEVTRTSTSKGNDDEFDSFGKYVAATLRSMPQEFSIIAKTELQNTLSEVQLRIVRQEPSSRSVDPLDGVPTTSFDRRSSGCISPTSDSSLPSVKIEFEN